MSRVSDEGLELELIPLARVRPNPEQPRRSTGSDGITELAASIREHGVLQPIRVRRVEGEFEIIAGERRWRAAQEAGLDVIPAVVAQVDDASVFIQALVENVQREDLNAVDRARALVRLRAALGLSSWEEVGRRIGIGRVHVHRLLGVQELPDAIQDDLRSGELTEKHARALLMLRTQPEAQRALWTRIREESLSGNAALEAARGPRATTAPAGQRPLPDAIGGTRRLVQRLDRTLAALQPGDAAALRSELEQLRNRVDELLGR